MLRLLRVCDRDKDTEILVLRHQVAVLECQLAGLRRAPQGGVTQSYLRGLGDTNILILLERLAAERLPTELLISSITLAELSVGVHSAEDAGERGRRITRLQRIEAAFNPLPFDAEAARHYEKIAGEVIAIGRKSRGRMADLMIASVAAANRLPLFTTNADDFRGLETVVTVVSVPFPTS